MGFAKELSDKYPELKRKLTVVHVSKTPEQYVAQNLQVSAIVSAVILFGAFLFLRGMELSLLLLLPLAPIIFLIIFSLMIRTVDAQIAKYAKEIDRDVLFAGRFLLVKLNSGKPLMNALVEASNSYGVASNYFKEIVRDIELGTPLEQSLEKASRYCPSDKMRRILFQISNALKIGVDVTNYLEAILDEIANDQLTEIKKYGRKLSGITMFYMLFAVVIPSLGITMLITVVSIVNIPIDSGMFVVMIFSLVVLELLFISIFKSIRPTVNI